MHLVIDATVDGWDAEIRVLRLRLDDHALVVASTVTWPNVEKGIRVTVSGHLDNIGRWVVTDLRLRPSIHQ